MRYAILCLVAAVAAAGCVGADDVDGLQEQVDDLEARLDAAEAEVATLEASLGEQEGRLADLERVGHALVEVVFGAAGGNGSLHNLVAFDPDTRPTAAAYTANGGTHPDVFSAHDLTAMWAEATGHTINVTWFSSSFGQGFFLDDIDGVRADDAFWALAHNGEAAAVGMSDLEVGPGDTITWTLTSFA